MKTVFAERDLCSIAFEKEGTGANIFLLLGGNMEVKLGRVTNEMLDDVDVINHWIQERVSLISYKLIQLELT